MRKLFIGDKVYPAFSAKVYDMCCAHLVDKESFISPKRVVGIVTKISDTDRMCYSVTWVDGNTREIVDDQVTYKNAWFEARELTLDAKQYMEMVDSCMDEAEHDCYEEINGK